MYPSTIRTLRKRKRWCAIHIVEQHEKKIGHVIFLDNEQPISHHSMSKPYQTLIYILLHLPKTTNRIKILCTATSTLSMHCSMTRYISWWLRLLLNNCILFVLIVSEMFAFPFVIFHQVITEWICNILAIVITFDGVLHSVILSTYLINKHLASS